MNEILKDFIPLIPLMVALIVWAVRLEVKIATITNDLQWIKKALNEWRPNSENHTP